MIKFFSLLFNSKKAHTTNDSLTESELSTLEENERLKDEINMLKKYNNNCSKFPFLFKVTESVLFSYKDASSDFLGIKDGVGIVVERNRNAYGYSEYTIFDGEKLHCIRETSITKKNKNNDTET